MTETREQASQRRQAITKARARLQELDTERREYALARYHAGRNAWTLGNVLKAPVRVARAVWGLR